MRPIKFRAWDIRCKHFIYYDIKNRGAFCIALDGGSGYEWTIKGGGGIQWWDKDRFILQQFTGLLDKNGKEVFEGDIISRIRGISEIVWSDDGWAVKTFAGWKTQENVFCYQRFCEVGEIEIIGNIYETPELLKGGR